MTASITGQDPVERNGADILNAEQGPIKRKGLQLTEPVFSHVCAQAARTELGSHTSRLRLLEGQLQDAQAQVGTRALSDLLLHRW